MSGPFLLRGRKPLRFVEPRKNHRQLVGLDSWLPFWQESPILVLRGSGSFQFDWELSIEDSSWDQEYRPRPRGRTLRLGDNTHQKYVRMAGTSNIASDESRSYVVSGYYVGGSGGAPRVVGEPTNEYCLANVSGTWRVYDGSWNDSGVSVVAEEHKHFVVTYDGGTGHDANLYIDGMLALNWAGAAQAINYNALSAEEFSGNESAEFDWLEFRYYDRVLSAQEVHELYSDPWAPFRRPVWIPVGAPSGVIVTPTAATTSAVSTAPTTILGSLTITPNASDASAVSTAPTAILGSVVRQPLNDAGFPIFTIDCDSIAPTVIISSPGVTVTPTAAESSGVSTAPTVINGSLTVTDAASDASATGQDPAVQLGGDLSVTPAAASASAVSTPPAVLDAGVFQPSASESTATSTAPSALFGLLTVTPDLAASRLHAFELTALGGAFIPRYDLSGIESEDDRDGLMIDSGETLTHNGTDYTVLAAELDGLTLDRGTSVDGIIDILIKCSDIQAGSIAEHDMVTYNSANYTISKIEEFGGGISVMYLD